MMRIAFLHFYTLRLLRGIETLVISLANELVQQNVDVSILSAKRSLDPLIPPDLRIHLHEYPLPRYYEHCFIAPMYTSTLVRERFDYIIVFFSDFGEAFAWNTAKRFIGDQTKLVVYLCYPYSAVPHRYQNLARAGFFRDAASVLADAQYVADDARSFVGRDISVVPAGTNPERFCFDPQRRRAVRQQYGYDDEHVVLLNVSALEPRKGVRRVIDVLPELRERIPSIRYLILGRGEDERHLRDQVEQRGVTDIVTFAGTTTDLPAYYSSADLFVMLPDNEANSVASHEALACQLPVIASRSGGFLETMGPTYSRLVDPYDQAEIINTIEVLARSPETRLAMGSAGRTHVQKNLSWRTSAEKLIRLLDGGR